MCQCIFSFIINITIFRRRMMLTILMGNGRQDLRGELLQDIQQRLKENPKLTIYYIVPNHIKFDSEVNVLERFAQLNHYDNQEVYAQSQLQVYSLTRLAWALGKNLPEKQATTVQSSGLFMIVSSILQEKAQQLPIFARMQSKSGFVDALVKQLVELRASRVTPEDILNILDQQTADSTFVKQTLQQKLLDLAVVADALDEKLGTQFITPQETLSFFASQMQNITLTDVAFYFEGFNGLTAAEYQVVTTLIQKWSVTISLLGDAQYLGQQKEGDVFFKPMQLAQELTYYAKQIGQTTQLVTATTARHLSNTSNTLLQAWESIGEYRTFTAKNNNVALQMFTAENPMVELQEVARRIRQSLATSSHLHLRDIVILARDLNAYQADIPAVMSQFDLPYFLDLDQDMMTHPLVELIFNLLLPSQQRFQYQNVLAILKTSLLRPVQDNILIDRDEFLDIVAYLDNYLLAYQPYESTWRDKKSAFALFTTTADEEATEMFQTDSKINQRLEALRQYVLQIFDSFDAIIKKSQTNREFATQLINWLVNHKVTDAILGEQNHLVASGELTRSQQGIEVWDMLTQTLNELVMLSGEERFQVDQFTEALKAGFAGAKFSGIPNSLDQITISEAGIVQSTRYQQLYFIGGTRQNLPAQMRTTALINDSDRVLVQPALAQQEQPKYLQNTAQQQMAEENLLFYGALAASQNNVTLSYPLLDATGNIAEISPYFKRLSHAFDVEPEKITNRPSDSAHLLKAYIGTPRATLSEMVKLLPDDSSAMQALRNALSKRLPERTARVLSAPNYQNTVSRLKPEFVSEIFGRDLNVSISQLESYYHNPLAYFLQYGLSLQERPKHELNIAQTGTLYHAIFESVIHNLIRENLSLRELTTADLKQLVLDSMAQQLEKPEFALLKETAKMRAITAYLIQVSQTLLFNLQKVARTGHAKPKAVEQLFGFAKDSLPALDFSLSKGSVHVRGKLDRLDYQDNHETFGTIIDYKSNHKKFDWAQAYNGLQMQLLTYWQAAQQAKSQLGLQKVGGAFFAKISPTKTKLSQFDGDFEQLIHGELSAELFKYRGLFIDDDDYLEALAHLDEGEKATYYALGRNRDGSLSKMSDMVNSAQLDLLLQRNKANIIAAGEHILNGDFPLLPEIKSMQYTPYRDILRFDRALGDKYHDNLITGSKQQILKLLENEAEL